MLERFLLVALWLRLCTAPLFFKGIVYSFGQIKCVNLCAFSIQLLKCRFSLVKNLIDSKLTKGLGYALKNVH